MSEIEKIIITLECMATNLVGDVQDGNEVATRYYNSLDAAIQALQEKAERESGVDLTVSGTIDSEGRCRNRNCNICDKLREEKADMGNGCDVCNNYKPLLSLYTEYSIEVGGREMSVWQGLKCEEIFKINHCPNCGRKLVEE